MASGAIPINRTARKREQELAITTYETSNVLSGYGFGGARINNDDLINRRGYGIYAEMLTDEQVKAVVQFKNDALLAPEWELVYPPHSALDADEQQRRIDALREALGLMRGSFVDALTFVMSARVYGFSMTEKVYESVKIGGRNFVTLNSLLPRSADTFHFFTNAHGTLQKIEQHVNGKILAVNPDLFVHYAHNPEEDRYYGLSDLRAAYRAWYAKDEATKLYLQYLSRFAGGFASIEQSDTSALIPGSAEHTAIQSMLANFRSTMGVILPRGTSLKIDAPATTAEFREALTMFDLQIAKALLIPNLLGISHSDQTGAYAQSQTQLETFFWTLNRDARRLEDCVNEQIIRDICGQNYSGGDFPLFRFKPMSQDSIRWAVDRWTQLVTAKAVQPSDRDDAHVRALLEFPPAQKNDDETEAQTGLAPATIALIADLCARVTAGTMPKETARALLGHSTALSAEEIAAIVDPIEPLPAAGTGAQQAQIPAPQPPQPEAGSSESSTSRDNLPASFRAAFSSALSRVDFAVINQRAGIVAEAAIPSASRAMARAVRRVLADDRLEELLDSDVTDIGELRLDGADIGKLKAALKDGLLRAWTLGQEAARREMVKATVAVPAMRAAFAAAPSTLRDNAAAYFEANGFRMAANLTDGAKAIIQSALLQGVKSGARPGDIVPEIYDRLIRKGFMTLDALMIEESRETILEATQRLLVDALDVANVPAYLNTLVRTNTFEALNEARYAEFTDPVIDGFVTALEYSAILDDRTTEICSQLDGHIHAADSAIWETYRPPNHYNCRSLLVPITQADGWDGVESAAPIIEPQEGFGG